MLSTPNLLTLDNEAASIFVGQTIPFVTGSYVTGGGGTSNNPFQTVQREEVGLKLNVRPQISEGGTVKLDTLSKAYWQNAYLSAKRVLPANLARNP